ncbi:hypothetical protein M8494_04765 [Serratia ureilytica]
MKPDGEHVEFARLWAPLRHRNATCSSAVQLASARTCSEPAMRWWAPALPRPPRWRRSWSSADPVLPGTDSALAMAMIRWIRTPALSGRLSSPSCRRPHAACRREEGPTHTHLRSPSEHLRWRGSI